MLNRRTAPQFCGPFAFVLLLTASVLAAAAGFGQPGGGSQAETASAVPKGGRDATAEIKELIMKYAAAVNAEPVDIGLASQVWSNSSEVSLIFPGGEERGWEQIKRDFYEDIMEKFLSERKLTPHDIRVHAYGDSAWAEFSWNFVAKSRKDGSGVATSGRETQIYRKVGGNRWVLVHVHYSAMPPAMPPGAPAKP
jgi:ketosteroid isomerase-like protein